MSYSPSMQVTLEKGSFDRLCITIPATCHNGVYTPTQTIFVQESPFGASVTIPWSDPAVNNKGKVDNSQTKRIPVQQTPHTAYILVPEKIDLNPSSPFDGPTL